MMHRETHDRNLDRSPLARLVLALALAVGLPATPADASGDGPEIVMTSTGAPTVLRRHANPAPEGGGAEVGLVNGDFAAGLDGWTTTESGGGDAPGSALSENGVVVLAEGDSFLVTLEQSFMVPDDADELVFDIALEPGFDGAASFIPDAFEVSLLDATNAPVAGSWDALATSSFNLDEHGVARTAPGVVWDGAAVRIDLIGVPVGLQVTLYFDLIGADEDTASALRLDDVRFESGPRPGDFVRGDSNADLAVNISDPSYSLGYLFLGGPAPGCFDAADANDDGTVDISDASYTLNYLFLGGPVIPAPYPACGADPSPKDPLECSIDTCGA